MRSDSYLESKSILRKKMHLLKDNLLNEMDHVFNKYDNDAIKKIQNIERKKLLDEILL